MLDKAEKIFLLKSARESIRAYLETRELCVPETDTETLLKPCGAFVTIYKRGALRGCLGSLESDEPLLSSVCRIAVSSATQDPRFPPLDAEELQEVDLEISVLSPLIRVGGPDDIELGRHGVLVRQGGASGVFLPQVALETGWDKQTFLRHLCEDKAGLPQDAWKKEECQIYVFTCDIIKEKELLD